MIKVLMLVILSLTTCVYAAENTKLPPGEKNK